jgi:sugar phosphate isomerase/epimerase
MAAIPISLQLYTVRNLIGDNPRAILNEVAKIGYKGVEIGGFGSMTATEYWKMLSDLGLVASAAWTPLPSRENIAELVETYAPFDVRDFVGGFGPSDFATIEDCKRVAGIFQACGALSKEHGASFSFHNHEWEFKPLPDGSVPYELLLSEAPDAFSELDIYWALFGGGDPVELVRRHSARLKLVHVKDGELTVDRHMTAVGSGKLDIGAILAGLDSTATSWLTVEIDNCHTDMMQAVRESYDFLVGNGYAAGNRPVSV